MKRTILILGAATVLMASLVNAKVEVKEPAVTINNAASSNIAPIQLTGGELLIAKSDCIGCHHKVNKLIGPSYADIAKKYPNNAKNQLYLANKIIKGGSGVWGKIPMTPHPKVSAADAKLMAKYILTVKK